MIVAITGNIGSGKSTASEIFRKHGFKVINADFIGHKLYLKKSIRNRIIEEFNGVLTNSQIDRRKLKDIVFHSPGKLRKLNSIMFPEIIKEIKKLTRNKGYYAVEAALLIEAGFREYDKLILITISRKEQFRRLLKKGRHTRAEISNIIKSQMPQEKKLKYADFVVDNSGTRMELAKNIKKIIIDV